MSKPLILSLIPKGHPEHPRFILANQGREFWTGNSWSPNENDPLLFADEAEAGRVSAALLTVHAIDKPVYRFTAPVEIEIRSDEPPDLLAVQWWLMRAARLYVDYRQNGSGPTDDGVILLSIDWGRLKEVSE